MVGPALAEGLRQYPLASEVGDKIVTMVRFGSQAKHTATPASD